MQSVTAIWAFLQSTATTTFNRRLQVVKRLLLARTIGPSEDQDYRRD
jgi:hypothetical protein